MVRKYYFIKYNKAEVEHDVSSTEILKEKYKFYTSCAFETVTSCYLNLFFLYLIVRLMQHNSDGRAQDPILKRDVPIIVVLQNQKLLKMNLENSLITEIETRKKIVAKA